MESKRMEEGIQLVNDRAADVPTVALQVLRELNYRHELSNATETKKLLNEDMALKEILHYFFQQAAFTVMKPANFSNFLDGRGVKRELCDQLAELWNSEAKAVVSSLKNQTILPQVTHIETSIHYHIAATAEAPTKSPLVILDLGVEENKEKSSLRLEFDEEELTSLYKLLEEIQENLDTVL